MTVPATQHNRDGILLVEGARILFRNFSGAPKEYNAEGDRNFCLLLDPVLVSQYQADGWNVKFLKPKEIGDEPQPYMQVRVKYRDRYGNPVRNPPRLVMVTSRGRTDLPEELAEILDMVDTRNVDVTIRPYDHQFNGGGRTAYLKTIVVTIEEDPLELKYQDVPVMEGGVAGALEMSEAMSNMQNPLAIEAGSDGTPPWDVDTDTNIVDAEIVED